MILDVLLKYPLLITDYNIIRYRTFGLLYELVAEISFTDNSTLYVRDYLFSDCKRKYSFHWQDVAGNCRIRWDNVPHHQDAESFPFHKHVGKLEIVANSEVMNLEKIIRFINKQLNPPHRHKSDSGSKANKQ